MNQILNRIKKQKKLVSALKFQVFFSVLGVITVFVFINYNTNNVEATQSYSKELFVNQKLISIYQTQKTKEEEETVSNIFGSIEIPKIGIIYPVFNEFSEELLKLSPCKFNGPNLNEDGNIAIAGHNLENHTFFSDLNQIQIDDIINIYSNSGEKFEYSVYRTYETESEDLTPLATNFISKKELTLVTCNNKNKKRFIVKALLND